MKTILDKNQYILIYKTSYLSLCSFCYALYNVQYKLSIVPCMVFLSSILYWHNPINSWRRYLDIVVVNICALYQFNFAFRSTYAIPYYIISCIGICFYPIGIYYFKKNNYWKSTYSHILLHIFANFANILLYSGNIID